MERRKRITEIDIDAVFADLIADPQKYGVENATIPCIIPDRSICSPEQALKLAFFDPLHPNSVIHGEIAGIVGARVAALLLLSGLAALGLAARRRGQGRFARA